jgi:hypothetical protein
MPLPELNTGGIDIGNTLRTVAALKAARRQEEEFGLRKEQIPQENALRAMQMQNLQSEITARGTPEEQAAGREEKNYVAMVQRKREDAALKTDDLKDTARALVWAKDHPNSRETYRAIKADKTKLFEISGGKIGIHPAFLPDEDYFQKKTVDETGAEVVQWDNDKFNKFADQGLLAVNMAQNPIEGKTWDVEVKVPPSGIKDEAGNIITPDISKYAKAHMIVKNGKPVMLGVGVTEDKAAKSFKPTNMPPWYDSMIKETLGAGANDPGKVQAFDNWLATPEGKKTAATYRKQYASETATPFFTVAQTAEGFVPINSRTGAPGEPTGLSKTLPSEQIVAQQQIGTLKETMSEMKKNYKPDYVGPVAGRAGSVAEKTIGIEPQRAKFNSQVAQLQNSLIYLMSGKQINEAEYERLKKQIPDINLPQGVFEARMQEFDRTVDSIIVERKKNMGGYGKSSNANKGATTKAADGVLPRNEGESVNDYLKRTGQK